MRKLLLAGAGLAMVLPFLYMVSVSFMGEAELLRWPPALFPLNPTTGNYFAALQALPYERDLMNTAILAGCVLIGLVSTSAAAGYAFGRVCSRGGARGVSVCIALRAVSAVLLLVPRCCLL